MAIKLSRLLRFGAKKKRDYTHLAALLYGVPLLLTQEKADAIADVFELHRRGDPLAEAEILNRIGLFWDDAEASDDDEEEDPGYTTTEAGIAILRVHGTMSQRLSAMDRHSGGASTEDIGAAFDTSMDDPDVRAVVGDFDTPGGSVHGVAELASKFFAARGKKPLIAVVNPQMASAGYWTGSGFDKVVISPSGLAGSIGVIQLHREASKANEKYGVKNTVLSVGLHKADGNPYEPLSDQSRATSMQLLSTIYGQFTSAVAKHRGASIEDVQKGFGQGKQLYGQDAVAAGLADRVGTLEEVVGELTSKLGTRTSVSMFAGSPVESPAAGAAAKENHQPPASNPKSPAMNVTAFLKAAAIARGLVNAEADDSCIAAAVNAFFVAKGESIPSDEAALLAKLAPPPATSEADKIRQAAATEERIRIADIQGRGALLGVEKSVIDAAVASGDSLGAALVKFTDAKAKHEPAVAPVQGGAETDKLHAIACEVIFDRVNCNVDKEGKRKQLSRPAAQMRYTRLVDIAAADLRQRGIDLTGCDPEDIARKWLKAGAEDEFRFTLGASAGDGSYQSPSDYPNVLSAVSGKMMDLALATNTATYRDWTYQLPPVADFKPKTIVATGGFSEIPLVEDGEDVTQSKRFEEASFIQVDSYSDNVKLTPVMVANDDLGVFQEDLALKVQTIELTLNRLCVNLITGNVVCADGNALFSTAHANLIAGGAGGAPSVAQTAAMRLLMRQQYDVGGQAKMRVGPRIALVGSAYETVSEQTFLPPPADSPAFYTADTSINFFRNKIIPVLEQQLDDWTLGASGWFLLADPALVRAIVYAHQIGFEGGKVLQWYDPRNRCRITQIEGRFAAAIRNWRGLTRNSGGSGSL